jgi:hypothetical protein
VTLLSRVLAQSVFQGRWNTAGEIELIGNGTAVKAGEHVRIFVEALSDEDPRFFADLMIHAGHKIIFVASPDGAAKKIPVPSLRSAWGDACQQE